MHRSAAVVLLDKKGRVLLQLRDNIPGIMMPNYWGLPGGSIKEKETVLVGVIREFEEETSYKLKSPMLFARHVYDYNGKLVEGKFYYEKYDEKQEIQCNEGKEMEFKTIDEIKEIKMFPYHDKYAIKAKDLIKGSS